MVDFVIRFAVFIFPAKIGLNPDYSVGGEERAERYEFVIF